MANLDLNNINVECPALDVMYQINRLHERKIGLIFLELEVRAVGTLEDKKRLYMSQLRLKRDFETVETKYFACFN